MLATNPLAFNKHVAYREALPSFAFQRSQHSGDLMNPLRFYTFGDTFPSFGDEVGALAAAAKGQMGEETKHQAEQYLALYDAVEAKGNWYRLNEVLFSGKSSRYLDIIWSPQDGFNPVEYRLMRDQAGTSLLQTTSWQWDKVDGIYVPAVVKETVYNRQSGQLSWQRQADLASPV